MNAERYAESKGVASLKDMAEVLNTTQKHLKEVFKSDPQSFDWACAAAHYKIQEKVQIEFHRMRLASA